LIDCGTGVARSVGERHYFRHEHNVNTTFHGRRPNTQGKVGR